MYLLSLIWIISYVMFTNLQLSRKKKSYTSTGMSTQWAIVEQFNEILCSPSDTTVNSGFEMTLKFKTF